MARQKDRPQAAGEKTNARKNWMLWRAGGHGWPLTTKTRPHTSHKEAVRTVSECWILRLIWSSRMTSLPKQATKTNRDRNGTADTQEALGNLVHGLDKSRDQRTLVPCSLTLGSFQVSQTAEIAIHRYSLFRPYLWDRPVWHVSSEWNMRDGGEITVGTLSNDKPLSKNFSLYIFVFSYS